MAPPAPNSASAPPECTVTLENDVSDDPTGRGRRTAGRMLVTAAGARVREGAPRDRHEAPLVAPRVQDELQDAEGAIIAGFAIGQGRSIELVQAGAPRPHRELAEPANRVELPIWLLGSEPLVDVIVAVQDDLRGVLVEGLPERAHRGLLAVTAGAESGVVPVCEGAHRGMGGELRP